MTIGDFSFDIIVPKERISGSFREIWEFRFKKIENWEFFLFSVLFPVIVVINWKGR
ncbi:hypothetical protein B4089_1558 [Bacillus licheniformis]|nr:hypothetical protein B4089_1558 [Bacillus licheniformis]